MKKLFFALVLGFAAFQSNAQETTRFGITAGYLNLNVKASYEGMSASVNGSGFYVGGLAEIPVATNFYLQPAVLYGNAEESGLLYVPVMAKLYLVDSGLNVQAGPQATFILDESEEGTNSFGLDLALGAGYDITENFFLDARYAFELTNRVGEMEGLPDGVKSTINSFTVGIGYKF